MNIEDKINKMKKRRILIKDIEKDYKISFGVNSRMKLSTYLKKKGFVSIAKALKRIEK